MEGRENEASWQEINSKRSVRVKNVHSFNLQTVKGYLAQKYNRYMEVFE